MVFPRTIYAIQHNVTKKIYIGCSNNPYDRYLSHMSKLRNGKHTVEDMQEDFNRYGENYSFFLLEVINEWIERKKEYEWMMKYRTFDRQFGYNYKDNEKEILRRCSTPPLVKGIPEISGDLQHEILHDEYTEQISKLCKKCEDIDFLKLLLQMLTQKLRQEVNP